MQTVVHVVCSRGASLRELIVCDRQLRRYYLRVHKQQQAGRSPGWAKLHGTKADSRGALNVTWDSTTSTLVCRVISKGASPPSKIIGDFVTYLLGRHNRRIKFVVVLAQ